jgi:hypothetical protein
MARQQAPQYYKSFGFKYGAGLKKLKLLQINKI